MTVEHDGKLLAAGPPIWGDDQRGHVVIFVGNVVVRLDKMDVYKITEFMRQRDEEDER